jgi:hypothetical protein
MNKSSEVRGETNASMQTSDESAQLADPQVVSEATERRSPHRVISTASYYHPERRGRVFGDGADEFPEGPEGENEMDGDSGDGGFR